MRQRPEHDSRTGEKIQPMLVMTVGELLRDAEEEGQGGEKNKFANAVHGSISRRSVRFFGAKLNRTQQLIGFRTLFERPSQTFVIGIGCLIEIYVI